MSITTEYKGKMSFNIRIKSNDNLIVAMLGAIEEYKENYGVSISLSDFQLVYRNETYSLTKSNFKKDSKTVTFKRASDLVINKLAVLYIAKGKMLSKLTFSTEGKEMLLSAEDMNFSLKTNHKISSKYLEEIDNGFSILLSFVEHFKGNLVFYSQTNSEKSLFAHFQYGQELNNIEEKNDVCEKLYNDYKMEIMYKEMTRNIILKAKVSMIERKLASSDNLLSLLLLKANQDGFKAIIEQNNLDYKLKFVIQDTNLLEVIQDNLSTKDLTAYNKKSESNRQGFNWYSNKKYKQLAEFDVDTKSTMFHSIFNLNELLNSMSKKNYIANIEQTDDNDIVIELFNTKVVKQVLAL